ncbi:MAG: hypothetical protein H6Q60_480 [Oscillospiraceae bacterium]|nr:hypothetical protein [Oscillospiraceae bacterium]
MKMIKQFGAVLLALAMTLSLGMSSAFATTATGTISFKNTDGSTPTAQYTAYQIASIGGVSDNVYTDVVLNSAYKSTLVTDLGLTSSATDSDILTALQALSDDSDKIIAIAYDLQGELDSSTKSGTWNSGSITGLSYGYYLIVETSASTDGYVASRPIIVAVPDTSGTTSIAVTLKNSKASIDKKIVEGGSLVDSSTAAIGDSISYQSVSSIPYYPSNATNISYTITDTFSSGLTYNEDISVALLDSNGDVLDASLDAGTDYTYSVTSDGFIINLSDANVLTWGAAGDKLQITYSATLNDSATVGSIGNPNTIGLTYGVGSDTYSTYDTVITYTAKLVITKNDSDGNTLADATFALYKADSNGSYSDTPVQTVTTGDSGIASFTTLEQGTYKLVETVAPSGYNTADDVIFTVTAKNDGTAIPSTSIVLDASNNTDALAFTATWSGGDNFVVDSDGNLTYTVTDTKGFTLPGTGGSGTTLFTIGGIGLITLAGAMLILYNKKHNTGKRVSK